MHRLKHIANLDTVPKPCEYFDVIGGAGTGGVIALMLGRLRMPIDAAIEEYVKFSRKVYSDVKKHGSQKFKATTFVSGMKDILKAAGYPVDLLILEDDPSCLSFVIALPAANMTPRIFRSYKVKANEDYNCTLIEAARATTATPQFFKPVIIGSEYLSEKFIGASFGHHNPTSHVLKEAELNVQHGLQKVTLDDWNRLGDIKTHSMSYLHETEITQKNLKNSFFL
ncbi:hypothetical protein H0H92_001133 [Tricholoma furcatifolium]|nr:hypothetical protein H0H92_001133 [Tricholoma furcatifolium]